MLHEPATIADRDPAAPYKARLGVRMFVLYAAFYAGFVAITFLSPLTMGVVVVAGLNLATAYGMALIIAAMILALIYHAMCRRKEAEFVRSEASTSSGDTTSSTES